MGVQINGDTGNVIATKGTFSGDVGIGGTLTYEDVTNIDSVGLITARSGIEIGASPGVAASISVDGNMIVSGISTFGDDVQVPDKIIHSGDTNTAIRFPAADTVSVETGGTERLRITSDGKYQFPGTGGGSGTRGLEIDTESIGAADEGVILNARASGNTGQIKLQTNSATAVTVEGNGGNVNVASNLKVAGVCTATSFSGSGAALTGISAGITELDHWYLTSNKTSNGDITANLLRANQTGATIIGSGMAESSGIFTFPSTGKYLIIFTGTFVSVGNDSVRMRLAVTTNNTSYTEVSQCIGGQSHYSGGSASSATASTQFYFLDVTDTSNVKVKFVVGSIAGSSHVEADTDTVRTGFVFARIGDT